MLPRQQTLRAVVDWSWDLLDAGERAVLRRLSVFAGGCDLTAAEAVCADPGHGPSADAAPGGSRPPRARGDDIATVLGSLVDKSLVVAVPASHPDAGMRYRLLETVAEYAAERLDEAGDRAAAERAHLVHYRELARTTDPLLRGAEQRVALDTLQREYENLRTALRRAHAARDEHEVLCLVLSLTWYWQMVDQRVEARHWATAAVELGPDPFAEPAGPAPPIHQRCTDTPPPMSDEVLEEARREVRILEMINADLSVETWVAEHEDWLRVVTRVYRAGLPQTCRHPGMFWLMALLFTGHADRLVEALDETVLACEEFGYDWDLASVLRMRANVRANRAVTAEAGTRDAERALALFERLGDAWGSAEALAARGEAHEKTCRFAEAAADYTAALQYAERLGARNHVALLRVRLAQNLVELGRGAEAEEMLRDVLAAHSPEEGGGNNHDVAPAARMFLALWLGRTGRRQEAREQLRQVQELFHDQSLAFFGGFIAAAVAWLDVEDGSFAAAREGVREALNHSLMPLSRTMAPEMGAGPGRDAVRLLGAYEALVPEGHVRSPYESELYEAAEKETLEALLGDTAAHPEARAAGAALSLEEATALV
ncbi:ATP-binding protein [Streptomyces sp. 8L]|uniref:ATP-binding protein n=1 Tax=Streptomyces sp. 8L TaxID=2877242 RepID=UPI001CD3E326|nr:hypothetical protein [Streptomyces sp. 8L]MCA1224256.1 hypothetical protein [Streptomyces sp. 8L]